MLIEVRTLVERASASRVILDGVIDVVPESHWQRREPAAAWTARNHLEHVASVDASLEADIMRLGSGEMWIGGTADVGAFVEARAGAMARLAEQKAANLRALMAAARTSLSSALSNLALSDLDTRLFVPGATDRWGQAISVSLREYLVSWANHDREHAEAIRRAITTPPDLSAAALTMRRRN